MSVSNPAAAADRPGRLAVGVVGAGRVGTVLAASLAAAGHRVAAVSAVSDASRTRADALLPGVPIAAPHEVAGLADLLLLTVPDDVLPELVTGLAATGSLRAGQLILHTSGRYGIAVLEPARIEGAVPLALHPVMTFTGTSLDLHRLGGCVFGVTANDSVRPIAEALVLEMGGEPVWVAEVHRPLWHAALAHAANHLTTLVTSASDLLRAAEIDDPSRVLAPLLNAALDNALREGDAALTGPVVRGDAGTVAAHVEAIERVDPQTRAAYIALARLTADRALASGRLSATSAEPLLDVLGGGGGGDT